MTVRDWDVKQDGEIPKITFFRKGFMQTKVVRIEDEDGVWFGVSDGKLNLRVALLLKSAQRAAADAARQPANDAAVKAVTDARAGVDSFKSQIDTAALVDDAAWAKLSDRDAIDHLRQVVLGSVGLQTSKPELVAQAVQALATPAAIAPVADAVALPVDPGPALEVKP